MKNQALAATVSLLLAIALSGCNSQVSTQPTSNALSTASSPSQTKFICGQSNGVPTTMAQTSRGSIPMIRWFSGYFSGSGYDPQTRCEQVSARFQTYHQNGTLKYIGIGKLNGYPILCVVEKISAPCLNAGQNTGVLFTLKPDANASETLRELLSLRDFASGSMEQAFGKKTTPVAQEDAQGNLFVDVEQYLKVAPVEKK